MATTKTGTFFEVATVDVDATNHVAGAGDVTTDVVTVDDSYGIGVFVTIDNESGSGNLTLGGQVQIEVSFDNSHFSTFGGPLVGGVVDGESYHWGGVPVDAVSAKYIRCVFGGNTGQDAAFTLGYVELDAI